jgi:hypothetical protein
MGFGEGRVEVTGDGGVVGEFAGRSTGGRTGGSGWEWDALTAICGVAYNRSGTHGCGSLYSLLPYSIISPFYPTTSGFSDGFRLTSISTL